MKFTANNRTDQAGIHFFSYVITRDFGHICRLNVGPDVGIDAQIEIVTKNGDATGAYIGVQIKSTNISSAADEEVRYIDAEHREYWKYQSIAVLFAVVNYSANKIWIKEIIDQNLVKLEKSWRLSFGGDDLIQKTGAVLFQKLARPDPSDPVMRRLKTIAKSLEKWSGSQDITPDDDHEMTWKIIGDADKELSLLQSFVEIDPIRYGISLRNDINSLRSTVNHLQRELSYYRSVSVNGM